MTTGAHALVTHDRPRAAARAGVLAALAVSLVWASGTTSADATSAPAAEAGDRGPGFVASRSTERSALPVTASVTAAHDGAWDTSAQEGAITVVSRAEREAAERAVLEAIAAAEAARIAEEEAQAAAAQAIIDAEAKAKADAEEAARPKPTKPRQSAPPETGSIKAYASDLVGGGDEFACLDALWQKESGWNYTADNPTSSAYGIPQALPGKKMASAGADWETNPQTQVRWGVSYIDGRYGTACNAWAHSQEKNWY